MCGVRVGQCLRHRLDRRARHTGAHQRLGQGVAVLRRRPRGLRRFSLRTKRKVDIQWLVYCMVHNIGKVQETGERGSGALG
jgi:hypothetical protein